MAVMELKLARIAVSCQLSAVSCRVTPSLSALATRASFLFLLPALSGVHIPDPANNSSPAPTEFGTLIRSLTPLPSARIYPSPGRPSCSNPLQCSSLLTMKIAAFDWSDQTFHPGGKPCWMHRFQESAGALSPTLEDCGNSAQNALRFY